MILTLKIMLITEDIVEPELNFLHDGEFHISDDTDSLFSFDNKIPLAVLFNSSSANIIRKKDVKPHLISNFTGSAGIPQFIKDITERARYDLFNSTFFSFLNGS